MSVLEVLAGSVGLVLLTVANLAFALFVVATGIATVAATVTVVVLRLFTGSWSGEVLPAGEVERLDDLLPQPGEAVLAQRSVPVR